MGKKQLKGERTQETESGMGEKRNKPYKKEGSNDEWVKRCRHRGKER